MIYFNLNNDLTNNLNNPTYSTDNIGIRVGKEVLNTTQVKQSPVRTNVDWEVQKRFEDGITDPIALFSPHFILSMREALSTGNVSAMERDEYKLFFTFVDWVDYEEGTLHREVYREKMLIDDNILFALDMWLVQEVECSSQRTLGNPRTHIWNECVGTNKILKPHNFGQEYPLPPAGWHSDTVSL